MQASLIRIKAFLKYAGVHLDDAGEEAFAMRNEEAVTRCSDAAVAMIKAVDAALASGKARQACEDPGILQKMISQISFDQNEAKRLAGDLFDLVQARDKDFPVDEASMLIRKGRELLDEVKRLCLPVH